MTFNLWFKYLTKPWFSLPNWAFAPVWAVLFVLMGISVFLIWEQKTTSKKSEALVIFYIQLAANICWPIAFFGMCSTVGGFIIILYLLASVVWTIKRFYGISKTAAYMLVPYFVWICYVTVLNFSIYYLNLN
jgi:tryptophan-rich sensory protein